jgi:hypothetical protein
MFHNEFCPGVIMTVALNRRKIIGLALALMSGATVGRVAQTLAQTGEAQKLVDNLGSIGNLDNLRMLGRQCLDLMPKDQASLLKMAGVGNSLELQEQIAGFTRKRQEDFLLGRTQIISGWVLAEAECAICILSSQA